jgi:hypothetical protein
MQGPFHHVLRLRRAVDEVPLPERALLALDDQEGLAREHEEGLCLRLPVVHRVGLAGLEDGQVDAEHRKERVGHPVVRAGERQALTARAGAPARVACVEDEPACAGGDEACIRLLERGFRDVHGRMIRAACGGPGRLADRERHRHACRDLFGARLDRRLCFGSHGHLQDRAAVLSALDDRRHLSE